MRLIAAFSLLACVVLAASGCTSPQPEAEDVTDAADVVATFDGGSVTALQWGMLGTTATAT